MAKERTGIITYASQDEEANRDQFYHLLKQSPIPPDQLLSNIGLFIESKNLARILLMDFLYRQIIDVHGVVMELGTRWGQNVSLFAALRGIYDPFNRHRKIIAFDTFSGFPSIAEQDGNAPIMEPGFLSVTPNYQDYLAKILETQEKLNPLSHIPKFELCAGDATVELGAYINRHQETIVALAFFDFDLYEPTKKCLEVLIPRLTKGSIVAFDELNDPDAPGETLAVMEAIGLNKIRLKRYPYASRVSYFIWE